MVVALVLDLFAIVLEMVDLYATMIELIDQTLVLNLGAIHKDLNVVALWLATMEKVVVNIENNCDMVTWGVNYVFIFFTTCIKKGILGGFYERELKNSPLY